MTKLKNFYCDKKRSNWDKTKKLKLWQNSKTQIVTKVKKIKLWQNSKTKIVTVVIVKVVTVAVLTAVIVTSFSKDNLKPQQAMDVLGAAFCNSRNVKKKYFLY